MKLFWLLAHVEKEEHIINHPHIVGTPQGLS